MQEYRHAEQQGGWRDIQTSTFTPNSPNEKPSPSATRAMVSTIGKYS